MAGFDWARPFAMKRRSLAVLLGMPLLAWGRDSALPVPRSLQQSARSLAARGQPLVLLVSLPGCPFCELVRRSYLMPLVEEAGLQAMQIDVTDDRTELLDFQGRTTRQSAQARAWKATFTPTVLFFGPTGEEVAERLVGIAVPDFYGAYLDQRLETARRKIKG
jgi:thioredoxin-related protein